jgi:hypothetical protein
MVTQHMQPEHVLRQAAGHDLSKLKSSLSARSDEQSVKTDASNLCCEDEVLIDRMEVRNEFPLLCERAGA